MVNRNPKLAIVTTHPVQYNAPLFQLLAERKRVQVKVFYTWSQASGEIFDPGFGNKRVWDIPLLKDYDYQFVENTAKCPGSHHYGGIKNPGLKEELKNWSPDAILVFGWCFDSHLKVLRYFRNKIPVFFRGDSTLLDERLSLKTFARRLFLKWVYRHVDLAFFVGSHNKAYFEKHGLKPAQLIPAPHAVDNDRFSSLKGEEEMAVREWKKQLGIDENDFVVLFVGKLEEKKNPQFILALADELQQENLKFLLVGNGRLEKNLKGQSKDKRILFLDFQNQSKMPLVYRLGNVLLLPSKGPGETWGLAANEAMACGLPVILSRKVGGAPDLVPGGETGMLFNPGQTERVAEYIRRLQSDNGFLKYTCRNAQEHIGNFHYKRTVMAIENAMLSLVN